MCPLFFELLELGCGQVTTYPLASSAVLYGLPVMMQVFPLFVALRTVAWLIWVPAKQPILQCADMTVTLSRGGASVSRSRGGASVSRSAGGASVSRSRGGASVSRSCGGASVSRSSGGASVSRSRGGASVFD